MKRNSKILASVHAIVLILLIAWNYYSNTGIIADNTVASVSQQFDNLFVPAGYAFAIWGLIYLGLLVLAGYMLYTAFSNRADDSFIPKAAPWLILAHISNGAWLWFWLHEQTGIALILIASILLFLIVAVIRLNMERWDAPVRFMAAVWWPIDIYAGWLAVATIANTAAHLTAIGWEAPWLSEVGWTVAAITLATALNLFMIVTRNMREFAGVGIWALIAIAVRHWDVYPSIQWAAVTGAAILFIATAVHAYKNRATLPHIKLQKQA